MDNLELYQKRTIKGEHATISDLYVDGSFFCNILEDTWREYREGDCSWKVPKQTAIPAGRYHVVPHNSPRFHKRLPMLEDVPCFDYVLIHSGNAPADTEGCLLVGVHSGHDWVGQSRPTHAALMVFIERAWEIGQEVFITIED